jgi:hypothetical protein
MVQVRYRGHVTKKVTGLTLHLLSKLELDDSSSFHLSSLTIRSSCGSLCNFEYGFKVIIRCGSVAPLCTTRGASMQDNVCTLFHFYTDRLHKTSAHLLAITRVNIDMPTPQASWAVVRVAAAMHKMATLCAAEIFFCASESFHCRSWLLFYVSMVVDYPRRLLDGEWFRK